MTTDHPHSEHPAPRATVPSRVVLGPLAVTVAAGLVVVGLGGLVSGSAGAAGAATGAALVAVVFAFGAVVVGTVARISPTASLLVALLTYTLQVVAVGVVYLALRGGGALDGPLDPRWVSAAVIAGTLAWTTSQVVFATKARQPTYELPSVGAEASVR